MCWSVLSSLKHRAPGVKEGQKEKEVWEESLNQSTGSERWQVCSIFTPRGPLVFDCNDNQFFSFCLKIKRKQLGTWYMSNIRWLTVQFTCFLELLIGIFLQIYLFRMCSRSISLMFHVNLCKISGKSFKVMAFEEATCSVQLSPAMCTVPQVFSADF